jgi:hypothetical protein
MSITAKIAQQNSLKARVSQQQEIVAQTVKIGVINLKELADVDISQLEEGSVLIYNSTADKFETKSEVSNGNLRIIGGSF